MPTQPIDPTRTVSFSGYRPEKILKSDPFDNYLFAGIHQRLVAVVLELASRGYTTFLSGMAAGFDLMAADAVLLAKRKYPETELVCVVPFPGQATAFAPCWKLEHARIVKLAARTVTMSENYHRGVFHRRNDYLIANSSVLACYYDGQPGGTRYTVNMALRHGLQIVNLCRTATTFYP